MIGRWEQRDPTCLTPLWLIQNCFPILCVPLDPDFFTYYSWGEIIFPRTLSDASTKISLKGQKCPRFVGSWCHQRVEVCWKRSPMLPRKYHLKGQKCSQVLKFVETDVIKELFVFFFFFLFDQNHLILKRHLEYWLI